MSKADLFAAVIVESVRVSQQNAEFESNVHTIWKREKPAEVSDFRVALIEAPPAHIDLLGCIWDGLSDDGAKLRDDGENLRRYVTSEFINGWLERLWSLFWHGALL